MNKDIFNTYESSINYTNCTFIGSTTNISNKTFIRGIRAWNTNFKIKDSNFINLTVNTTDKLNGEYGGSIFIDQGDLHLENSRF